MKSFEKDSEKRVTQAIKDKEKEISILKQKQEINM